MSVSKRNASGCLDLVAQEAIENVEKEQKQKAKTIIKTTEFENQKAVIEWAKWHERKYPELKWLHAIPNGGSRHIAEATNLKRTGVKAGVPDLHLSVARRGYHSLYIEMKSMSGRVSDIQTEWINGLREVGNAVYVCYTSEEAIGKLVWYLG